jgi:hypothetical protein
LFPFLLISYVAGPVAHLGERIVRNDEVVGSIPIRSTIELKSPINRAFFFF